MAGITASVYGNIAVLENLEKACLELQVRAQEKLEQAGQMALDRANERTPVRTGYLRSRNQVQIRSGLVILSNDAPYAKYVELGTYKARSQPFLVPAWLDAGYWLKEQLRNLI